MTGENDAKRNYCAEWFPRGRRAFYWVRRHFGKWLLRELGVQGCPAALATAGPVPLVRRFRLESSSGLRQEPCEGTASGCAGMVHDVLWFIVICSPRVGRRCQASPVRLRPAAICDKDMNSHSAE